MPGARRKHGVAFAGPGGWQAAGLVAAWAVPLAGLAALSWVRPGWAVCVLAVSSLGSLLGFASLPVVSAAPVITGILHLVSAHLAGRPPPAGTA